MSSNQRDTKFGCVVSQLGVLGSYKTNLGSVVQGAGNNTCTVWEVQFFK